MNLYIITWSRRLKKINKDDIPKEVLKCLIVKKNGETYLVFGWTEHNKCYHQDIQKRFCRQEKDCVVSGGGYYDGKKKVFYNSSTEFGKMPDDDVYDFADFLEASVDHPYC